MLRCELCADWLSLHTCYSVSARREVISSIRDTSSLSSHQKPKRRYEVSSGISAVLRWEGKVKTGAFAVMHNSS